MGFVNCVTEKYNSLDDANNCVFSENDWINNFKNLTWIRYQERWPDLGTLTFILKQLKKNGGFVNRIIE